MCCNSSANTCAGDESDVISPHGGLQLRFLLDPVWLVGAMLGSSGDVAQGLALQFTSSTLVVAIGMGNGLVTAVLTATLLREPTSLLVVSSCILTIVGTVLMVLGVPAEMEPMTAMELELYLAQTGFLVYALLMAGLLALCAGLLLHARGDQCILVNICISALASVPYTIAVKAIVMTVSELGELVSVRTAAWFVVVVVSFFAHVIFLNKGLVQFDPVRISQLSSCFLHLSFTATMMLLSQSWQEATPYHVFLLMLGVADVSFALFAFMLFQDDHQRSDTAVQIALRLLIAGSRAKGRTQPRSPSPVAPRPRRILASKRRRRSR
ncbi:magnesium transporter NIPA2 [Dermacentor silvarum]|uniref:magnesium transporter NIPA2 n=1 Tax=Dermacentor silvarum TaxID=543639 RepID=UPI00189B9E92|nr:magnesium transporter NIPA2 [Dermacentor silvarum]